MQIRAIIEDFLDYRAYISHTLCQHRLFLGLSNTASAREWLSDAAVWPLVHDEAIQLCNLAGTLYGIVIMPLKPLGKVFVEVQQRAKEMEDVQAELVSKGSSSAFKQFCELSRSLTELFREMYTALDRHPPEFSREAVLIAFEGRTGMHWRAECNEHMKTRLAPLVTTLLAEQEICAATDMYRQFWRISADGYLLTRKAVVAAAVEDLPSVAIEPVRDAQRLLRGVESVVSCWAPSVPEQGRQEQIEKSIRAQGSESRADLVARLEKGIHSE